MKKLLSTIFLSLVVSLFTTSLKADGHDFTIFNNSGMLQFDGGGSDPEVLAKVAAHVKKLSGVTPKVIVPNMQDTTEQLNLLLAGSNPPDLFQANWDVYKSTLMPLNDLLAKHGDALLRSIPETSWKYMTDSDGNIMGIPRTAATSPFMTWVRQDILDQAGLDGIIRAIGILITGQNLMSLKYLEHVIWQCGVDGIHVLQLLFLKSYQIVLVWNM